MNHTVVKASKSQRPQRPQRSYGNRNSTERPEKTQGQVARPEKKVQQASASPGNLSKRTGAPSKFKPKKKWFGEKRVQNG
jgi:hypothetical protein